MTSWQDENGTTVVENTYDEKGRVTSQKDANGNVAKLSYSGNTTTATDNNGNVTVYTYDDRKRTTKVEYPDGTEERFAYDGNGQMVSNKRLRTLSHSVLLMSKKFKQNMD